MRRKNISYYLLLCGLLISGLFSSVRAQSVFLTGEAVYGDGGGLEVSNSIVWGNITESGTLSGGNNLTDRDPLFASETDFVLRTGSPAEGAGDNSVWGALGLSPAVDIAGVLHATPMNTGAYENSAEYRITYAPVTGGTIIAYLNHVAVTDGTELTIGTELVVAAIAETGYMIKSVTANDAPIQNGAPYILTGNVEFGAIFEEVARKNVYATMQSGGTLSVHNTIIHDNLDLFGNFTLASTNVVTNPKYHSLTKFIPGAESPALGIGDAAKIPEGVLFDLAGIGMTGANGIDAGAYQSGEFTLSWETPAGGIIEVFRQLKNEAKETIEVAIASGESYPSGTIVVQATPDANYTLTSLKVNGGNFGTLANLKGSFILSANSVIEAVFTSLEDVGDGGFAAWFTGVSDVFVNNIVFDNLHYASNRLDQGDPKNLTESPGFLSATSFQIPVTSAAANIGSNTEAESYTTDLAGKDRIQGGQVDMGAFESASEGFTVTYTAERNSKGKTVARLTLLNADDNDAVIPTGSTLPVGTRIKVQLDILDENYEQLGRIRLNTDEYIEGNEFILEKVTSVAVTIQAKQYIVSYSATGGHLEVYNGTEIVANGTEMGYGTILTIQPVPQTNYQLEFVAVNGVHVQGAESGGGYLVTVTGDLTITANSAPIYELDEDGNPIEDPDNPGSYLPASPKGLITWDLLNATLTATAGGQAVSLGDKLEPGTVVTVTVAPTDAEYGIQLYQLNGTDLDKTQQTFRFTVPEEIDGKVASTFIAVRYGEGGWMPGDPDPEPTETVYVTMVIPDTMPEGITLNPAPGTYQVAVGSSRVLRFTVDEQYEDQYVFLRINGDYVMVKAPQGLLEFAYTLIDIRQALTIEVIISDTANPEEGTVGNATLTPGVRVTGESGKLTVESDRATKVLVCTTGGKLVANGAVNGTKEFYLPAGIYIVRTTISTPVKVVVR